ncbi:MAG: LysM peptidoglycan-binding domain-containing protein [Alphaproteobacteria bacterium]|nr:LysM peptidoglycan-binding domain-containing protein [Alphaproteobacteria bacterium]
MREPRARQLARLPTVDFDGEFELPSVSAPEPFDYADDDETDTLGEFVLPIDRAPSPRIALLRDPSAAPSATDASLPVQAIVADAASPAVARSTRAQAKVTAPNTAEGPKGAGTAIAPVAPGGQSAKPEDRPKRVWRSTRPPVSLLPTRHASSDKAADPQPADTFGPIVSKRGAGASVIEIRPLSNASESVTADGSHEPGPADQPLDAIVRFSDPKTPATSPDAKSPAATRSANLASLERATQRRAAPKHDGATSASTLTERDKDAKPPVLVWTSKQGETSRPGQRIAAKTPGSGNDRPEAPAAAPSVPTVNVKSVKVAPVPKSKPPQNSKATHKDKDTAKTNEKSVSKDKRRTHRVARDETVFSISMRYKVDIKALVRLNKIPPSNKIVVGQTLIIPDPVTRSTDVVRSADRDAALEPDRIAAPGP